MKQLHLLTLLYVYEHLKVMAEPTLVDGDVYTGDMLRNRCSKCGEQATCVIYGWKIRFLCKTHFDIAKLALSLEGYSVLPNNRK